MKAVWPRVTGVFTVFGVVVDDGAGWEVLDVGADIVRRILVVGHLRRYGRWTVQPCQLNHVE
jgi:hypothetical protein